ncbi:MAG: hypothetical protein B7Y16_00415 [Methylotenera sp. 24-45-7]|jgi:hypothetical protein|nr:MAG: hypothetical protein B7Y16_00415 [Methylotenera sp. 24-45-7]OZA08862.1 MAG: hypothetical protein B7X97_04860 [Methylotenera sp. 17-45-7]HQS38394.1 DUF692 domain-containing protein [Methylotenera sp.]HQS43309.1 DUF692 domain-containing protein [Methylotenera sp.]
MAMRSQIQGAGLGLKRELIPQIQASFGQAEIGNIDFLEIAPENWINAGGKYSKQLDWFVERYPMVCHGLCLSLGGLSPLNTDFLKQVKTFLQQYQIPIYTEHLSYCSDGFKGDHGYLYDLLPIPFTEEAVHYVAQRIRQTQDILGQQIGVENASAYVAAPVSEMDELTFINAVISEANCLLHLDINNIYVNSVNFGFDPHVFLRGLPGDKIIYSHMAGHYQQTPSLLVDTHGANVIDPVWALLADAYQLFGAFPTLLERDNNIPPLNLLMQEINKIADYQHQATHPLSISAAANAETVY